MAGISPPPPNIAPSSGGLFWGGGTPDARTFCIYIGILGEEYFENSPPDQWATFVDDPADHEWDFLDGHDLWIWVCGFTPRGKIRDIVKEADHYALRILVYDKLNEQRLPITRYV